MLKPDLNKIHEMAESARPLLLKTPPIILGLPNTSYGSCIDSRS